MMRGYPDVDKYPGVEDWLPQEKWSMTRVFDDMQRWKFADASMTATHREQWAALRAWHLAYSTSDSITVGMMHEVCVDPDGKSLNIGGCPAMSWSAMWDLLDA
eukprot:5393351-Pleurochrysis_carterae.AAC.1